MIYVPKSVLEELNKIKQEKKIIRNSDAFDALVFNSKVTRSVRHLNNINPLDLKRKKVKDLFGGLI